MDAFADWLVSTPINGLVLNFAWSWPTLESLHFLALCTVDGLAADHGFALDRLQSNHSAASRAQPDAGRDRARSRST